MSIVEEIRENLNNGKFSCGAFIDLEKAFDTVNHEILLSKLEHYGIRDSSLTWIASYLSDRKQSVKLNGVNSKHERISCGVPQGSILGPLFFIIYVNDMHSAVQSSVMHHFADDTNLLLSSKDPKQISKLLNKDLKLLFEWLCANRLSLNVSKTEFIIFRPPKKTLDKRIVLKLNRSTIYESNKIKYLGLILDSRLSWNHHINELTKKLNRAVGIIYKIRSDCTQKVLISLYYSLFHSHLSYGLSVWGKSNDCYLSKLCLLFKKIVRAITFSDFKAHSAPILKKLGILELKDLFKYKTTSLMLDFDQNNLPISLSSLFLRRNDVHHRTLRDNNKNNLYTAHRFNNRHGYNSFSHNGAKLLNMAKDLPFYNDPIHKIAFLRKYKKSILETY